MFQKLRKISELYFVMIFQVLTAVFIKIRVFLSVPSCRKTFRRGIVLSASGSGSLRIYELFCCLSKEYYFKMSEIHSKIERPATYSTIFNKKCTQLSCNSQ